MDNTAFRLRSARAAFSPLTTYVHLKDLGSATVLPVDVAEFWKDPGARPELGSGRILMGWRVEEDLPHWEMHPAGDELLIAQSGAAHELHLLDVPDAICRQRLRERNASGEHPFQVSDADYDLVARHFVPPAPDEGFNVVVHTA